jgi:hypothetical protein
MSSASESSSSSSDSEGSSCSHRSNAVAGGRGGRGQGRGGRGGRGGSRVRVPNQQALIKSLPAALKACVAEDGWKIEQTPNVSPFVLLTEDEYEEMYASKKYRETYVHIADSMAHNCRAYAMDFDDASVFTTLLSNGVFQKQDMSSRSLHCMHRNITVLNHQ